MCAVKDIYSQRCNKSNVLKAWKVDFVSVICKISRNMLEYGNHQQMLLAWLKNVCGNVYLLFSIRHYQEMKNGLFPSKEMINCSLMLHHRRSFTQYSENKDSALLIFKNSTSLCDFSSEIELSVISFAYFIFKRTSCCQDLLS